MAAQDNCEQIFTYLNFYIDTARHSDNPADQCRAASTVSKYYEAAAICELIVDMETDGFFHHLIRSAQTRLWLLELSMSKFVTPLEAIKTSEISPFLAAIVANQMLLAKNIADISPTDWYSEVEYEEDYLYARFLYQYILKRPNNELVTILENLENALDGESTSRLSLCKGFLEKKEDECKEAFENLLSDHEKSLRYTKENLSRARDALFYTESAVYIEGLAWLRLLDQVGIHLDNLDSYKYCPKVARDAKYGVFEAKYFPEKPL
jgi:hypothetical protein